MNELLAFGMHRRGVLAGGAAAILGLLAGTGAPAGATSSALDLTGKADDLVDATLHAYFRIAAAKTAAERNAGNALTPAQGPL